jgi:flagellar biogenesis protein FliO
MTPLSRYVVETVVTLLGIVALSVVLLSVLRRAGVGRAAGPLELLARLPLEGRRAVYLVRVAETVYVLGASDHAMQKLGELPRSALPHGPALEEQSFSDVLKRALGRKGAAARAPSPTAPGQAAEATAAPEQAAARRPGSEEPS